MTNKILWRFDGLARHLIFGLVIFSSVITTLITAIDLYADYRRDIGSINNRIDFIQNSYLPTLIESVWVGDNLQVSTQLEGLSRLQDIEYIEIGIDGQKRWSAGKLRAVRRIETGVPLLRNYRGHEVNIGTLHIVASVDNVVDRILSKLLATLLRNLAKTLLIAAFMLYLFQRLAGRHLQSISRHLFMLGQKPDFRGILELDRPSQGHWHPDVLDEVIDAVNDMHRNINISQSKILAFNAELEQLVTKRTNDLKHQNERNELILGSTVDGFYAADQFGRLLDANPAYCRMLGYTREELLQLGIQDVEGNENPQKVAAHIAKIIANGHDRFDTCLRHKNGSLIEVETSVNLVELGGEDIFYAFVRDISERKLAQQSLMLARDEAERANAAKSEFLSRMSHELRTPLNAIMGFGQLLEMDSEHPLNELQHANVIEIVTAGRHLLTLINEILDLSRIESGQVEIKLEPLNIAPLIHTCVSQFQPLVTHRQIKLNLALSASCRVLADQLRLREVIDNLLSNAIKYNRDGGEIWVSCATADGQRTRISIRDTGRGIAADSLPRLFRPFERLESAYDGVEGTGIGLALAKRLVKAMHGEIGVESVPGTGSTFWFELPSTHAQDGIPDNSTSHPVAIARPGKQQKLLYIEDNPANLRLVQKVIALRQDINMLDAIDAETGIEMAVAQQPDIILLDIQLPGMDGFAALKILQDNPRTRDIPVIAVSANAMHQDIEQGKQAGFHDYLTKPLDIVNFLALLDRLLDNTTPNKKSP
jgi:PAS domain S-box-containing protein